MSVDIHLVDRIVAYLNELLAHDPDAVNSLCLNRVPCGKALATHPTVQVQVVRDETGIDYSVGILGILNGLCGAYDDGSRKGFGGLAVKIDKETGQIARFFKIGNDGE